MRSFDEFGRPRKSAAADREEREKAALERLQSRYGEGGGNDGARDRSRSRSPRR
jgi:hypothetical protein